MHHTSTYINQEYRKDYPASSKQCLLTHQMENKTFEESKRSYLQEITLDALQLTAAFHVPGASLGTAVLGHRLQGPALGCHQVTQGTPSQCPVTPRTPPFLGACQTQQPGPPQVRGKGHESLFLLSRKVVVHPSDQIHVQGRVTQWGKGTRTFLAP